MAAACGWAGRPLRNVGRCTVRPPYVCTALSGHMNVLGGAQRRHENELNGEIGVAAYGPLSPDPSYTSTRPCLLPIELP